MQMIMIEKKSKGWLLLNVPNLGPAAPRRQVEFKSKLQKSFPLDFSLFQNLECQLSQSLVQYSTLGVFCDSCPPKRLIKDNLIDIILVQGWRIQSASNLTFQGITATKDTQFNSYYRYVFYMIICQLIFQLHHR